MKAFSNSNSSTNKDPFKLGDAYSEWFSAVSKNPDKSMEDGMKFWQKSMQLSQQMFSSAVAREGQEKPEPVIVEEKGDRRFKHEDWSAKPTFSLIKQSYLMTSEWMRGLVTDVEGLDEHTAEKVKFFTERYLDAMSPTNFAATNPAVVEKIIDGQMEKGQFLNSDITFREIQRIKKVLKKKLNNMYHLRVEYPE